MLTALFTYSMVVWLRILWNNFLVHSNFVILNEVKDLGNTAQQDVDVHEILRRDAPLDDKN